MEYGRPGPFLAAKLGGAGPEADGVAIIEIDVHPAPFERGIDSGIAILVLPLPVEPGGPFDGAGLAVDRDRAARDEPRHRILMDHHVDEREDAGPTIHDDR